MLNIGYVAGLIDGEGCITFFRYRKKDHLQDNWFYYPMVQVGMTHKPLVRMLWAEFGGSYKEVVPKDGVRKPYGVWSIKGQKCIDLLVNMESFLVVKKAEALLLRQFWADPLVRLLLQNKNAKGLKGIEREQFQSRKEWYWLECKRLKTVSHSWNDGEFGEHPMPGSEKSAEGQSRAKQTTLSVVGRV